MLKKQTFLRAWWDEEPKDGEIIKVQVSTKRQFLRERVVFGGVQRGNKRVTVFCVAWNMDNPLSKKEMRQVATNWLDGKYKIADVDMRNWT